MSYVCLVTMGGNLDIYLVGGSPDQQFQISRIQWDGAKILSVQPPQISTLAGATQQKQRFSVTALR